MRLQAGRWRNAVALTTVAGLLAGCPDNNSAIQPPQPVQVTVQKPIQRKVTLYLELTGRTSASSRVDLIARVPGFLERAGYKDGERANKGDVLFVIEQAPYQASLQAAEAAVAQQQALLAPAQADLTRQQALGQNQVASRARIEEAQSRRDSIAAALEQAKAQLQSAAINLGYTEIKAPFDGLVSARQADPGALVGAGGPTRLATIVQIDPMHVDFSINEQQVLLVRQNLRSQGLTLADVGPVPIDIGLQTEEGYPHTGQLDYVAPEVDPMTGTLTARATIANTNTLLLPGLFVRVRVPVQRDVPALLVPDLALGSDQRGRYLLVLDDKNVVTQQPVQVGELIDGTLRIIRAGLSPDERVIIAGTQRAIPGSTVRPIEQIAATDGAR